MRDFTLTVTRVPGCLATAAGDRRAPQVDNNLSVLDRHWESVSGGIGSGLPARGVAILARCLVRFNGDFIGTYTESFRFAHRAACPEVKLPPVINARDDRPVTACLVVPGKISFKTRPEAPLAQACTLMRTPVQEGVVLAFHMEHPDRMSVQVDDFPATRGNLPNHCNNVSSHDNDQSSAGGASPSDVDAFRGQVPVSRAMIWRNSRKDWNQPMARNINITVIGAGSATFSLGLVKDLCLTENLKGSHVTFMDIDAQRLRNITGLAERYSRELGADLRFTQTTDRQAALTGADFVINTADVKGHHHARRVRELTESLGYYYYTPSALGHFYNFRLMLDIARDIERICPDAWLIQSGNPVFDGTTLMNRHTNAKIIGLCHGHYGYLEMANVLGLDPSRITWEAPGVNHAIWLTTFMHDGEDAYPILDKWIEEHGPTYWDTHVATRTHDIQMSRGVIDMYRMHGLMPIGDTPRLVGWWYHTDLATKKHWFGQPWGGPDTEIARPVHVSVLSERLAQVDAAIKDPSVQVTSVFGQTRTREQQVPIIDALANGVAGCFQVNMPNTGGIVAGIEHDVVVESQAWIDRGGVHPMRPARPLPASVMREEVMPKVGEMERGLEAFLTGDRRLLLLDILAERKTTSYDQAKTLLETVLAMPGHEEVAAHYR